jgi:transcriptional regulator with XRE-family HTH domain
MRLPEIGHEIRRARVARDLTQAALATAVGLSRITLNQLENGIVRDLGIRKVLAITDHLGLELVVRQLEQAGPDFVQMAATAASVSFKEPLTPEGLVSILLTGKVPAQKRPQMRALLEETSPALLRGLVQEAGRWSKPGRIEKNLLHIAHELGVSREVVPWLT